MEESRLFEILDNAFQDRIKDYDEGETMKDVVCKMLSSLELDNQDVDNLKTIQESPDKGHEIVLKNKLNGAQEDLRNLNTVKRKAEEEYDKNKKVLTTLKKKLSEELRVMKAVEKNCELLEPTTELNPDDQFKIEKYRTINLMFKQSTGIRWDYSAPENTARGYVKNKTTNSLQSFNFSSTQPSIISEKLWTLIENTSHPDWASFTAASDKENSKPK